ncbi:iron uptake porin [Geitlerinema sp. PCC 7407]|uniref:iron uptake porin n=1 Tax=Geitlerinema sp. PCC 7407 TaxID=1173025 RepID=UPI00029FA33F|nr:iron uptake porin [Geitlerinema sp. PCC 7407]AFY65212.1 cyanobacterial porin [Geitlerinema sp. PCC 7407]
MRFSLISPENRKRMSPALLLLALGFWGASLAPAQAADDFLKEDAASIEQPSEETGAIAVSELSDASSLTMAEPEAIASGDLSPLSDLDAASTGMTNVSDLAAVDEAAPSAGMSQVTSVSQLSDVQPTDWAFQALQSLVERYGCIAGYPDSTYRGNRAITRYEFAAGLNACLDRVNELIAAGTADLATQEDLATLQRLQEEFAAELATLRGRVDSLEARTAELEANQFSTTTKLYGQAIFGLQGRSENTSTFTPAGIEAFRFRQDDPGTEVNFLNNAQLSLYTQFSNRSILLTGLQAGNGGSAPRLTNDVILGYEGDTDNQFQLSDLNYRQLFGNRFALIVGPEGVNSVNVFRGANRVESAGQGPLSLFAQRNPVQNIGGGRGGIGFDWQITPRISFQGVYSASRPADNDDGGGIFGGDNSANTFGTQLTLAPTDTIDVALNYINSYSPTGQMGSNVGDDQIVAVDAEGRAPIKTHAYGATVSWRVSPKFTIGGWGGYTHTSLLGRTGDAETVNWMAFLNFPDLLGEGNLAGLYVGQPPKILNSSFGNPLQNIPFLESGDIEDRPGSTTHLEAFYRVRVSDNISITPGLIVVFNPRNNPDNDTITIGALRTTFSF